MTDADFLAGIAAAPADRVRRLVYADWLEEHADPRHELIRVCERMRELPVFGDDYWTLKVRRNELRPLASPDWLAAAGYDGSDYDPVFRSGWPDDWRSRWRVIREFTERWHGTPMPDVGGRLTEIAAEEERLGLTLPASVREFVAYAFDVFPASGARTVHRETYTMDPIPGQPDSLSLLLSSEADVFWSVRHADLHLADPPVRIHIDFDSEEESDVGPAAVSPDDPRVTDFVLGQSAANKPTAGRFLADFRETAALRRGLGGAFTVHWSGDHGRESYEHEAGVLAAFYPSRFSPSGVVLDVSVRRGVGRDAVPTFLWEYAATAHVTGGLFLPPEGTRTPPRRRKRQ